MSDVTFLHHRLETVTTRARSHARQSVDFGWNFSTLNTQPEHHA